MRMTLRRCGRLRGRADACGVCNGPGEAYECGCSDIPEGDCDCDGNVLTPWASAMVIAQKTRMPMASVTTKTPCR